MIHRVLVPTDFSERSARALRAARDTFPDADVRVIYALDRADRENGLTRACCELQAEGDGTLPDEREMIQRFDMNMRDRLERFVLKACNSTNISTTYVFGDVVGVILEAAQRWQVDLIYMGTHDYHGLERLLYGSVAEAVIQRATVPVLIHKEYDTSSTGASLRRARRFDREVREMRLS